MKIVALLSLLLVCACFNKDESNVAPVQKAAVTGRAMLEEIGSQAGTAGSIDLRFEKSNDSKNLVRGWMAHQARGDGAVCDAATIPVSPTRAQATYLSAGKIELIPVNESTALEVPESETHLYQREISGTLPSGFYEIQAAGADPIPAFKALLSMPVLVEEGQLNGTPLLEKINAIKKTEEVALEWRRPSFGTDQSIMVADFLAITDTLETLVECAIYEKDLDTNENTLRWVLPKVYVQQLPATPTAVIYLSRLHRQDGKLQNLKVTLQGLRTVAQRILIGE